jgi:PAS domain S-box-containing protein
MLAAPRSLWLCYRGPHSRHIRGKAILPPPLSYLAKLVLLAAVYYAAARLGLRYASIGPSISLVWPPTGIAFAALTLLGSRYWPGVTLGAFLANAATPVPLLAAAGIALGNTLEAVTAAYLLRRSAGSRPQLDDLRQLRTLILVAIPLGALCAALVGPLSLWATEALPAAALPTAVAVWWTGDLLGGLVVAPVFFSWAAPPQVQGSTRRLLEMVVLCVGTIAAAELGLGLFNNTALVRDVNYQYLLFPFVIWAGLRFGARGASLMTLAVSAVAVGHTVQGGGPFVSATAVRTLFEVACYLAVVAVTGLVLAAAVRWERHEATKALAQSEDRLRRALDAARMGTWFWSIEDNSLTCDENLRQLYGLSPGDRVSTHQDLLVHVHPEDRALVGEAVRRALKEGDNLDYEFRVLPPDGQMRWIADQGEVRRNEQGRPTYVTGVSTDVTERRLAEERLSQAQRMESVGRLAGGVAHEANNQMSVVMGAADFILQRSDVPEAVRDDAEFIRRAAERTAAVTAQLLAFSRRQILKPQVLNLNDVLTGWETVLRRVMGADGGVTLRLAPETGLVRADPGQLEQVVLNLALNARDAMPSGGSITVETFNVELVGAQARLEPTAVPPGQYVVLAVSDTGQGMDPETMSHIFEPFFTTKAVGQGTGLGLAMVYGIVKQSGGYIWAYSEPGQGSTFKIYLPRLQETASPQPAVLAEPVRPGAAETILVVEDEANVRAVMKRALEGAGYHVLEAGRTSEVIQVLTTHAGRVSLVLADVVMPGAGGPELARRIKEQAPNIPILFTSGYTDGEIARRGLLEPDAAFLQKPFTPAGLVRAVQERLAAARPHSE